MKPCRSTNISWFWVLMVVALCLLSRLPQLMSPYFHTDDNGDECVLGLMASHAARGQGFPFYFWGQSYGFSWIEVGAAALAIKFFGVSIFSLKVPMLFLWTSGCAFFYCALSQWTTRSYSFWMTCLFIFSPSWMGWSMRARSGYISAFLLTTIVLFLIAHNWRPLKKRTCLFIGILLGFIFFSQPVFLLGVVPLLVYVISKEEKFKNILICMAGFIGVFILGKVMLYFQSNIDYWKPAWFRPDNLSIFISSFKDRIFYGLNQDAGNYWAPVILSKSWCAVFLASLGVYVWSLITKRASFLVTLSLISAVLILGCTYFINCEDQYRYLLPLSLFLILWVSIQSFEWMNKNLSLKVFLSMGISVFIVLGALTAWNYKNSYRSNHVSLKEVPEMQKISKMIEFLKASGVKYVFSLDDGMSWKLLYFSQEQIISRWANMRSRHPEYNEAVSQAFLSGEKVALIGNVFHELSAYLIIASEGPPQLWADDYFIYLHPGRELIADKLRFQLYKLPMTVESVK